MHCLNNLMQGAHFDVSPRTASLRPLPATPPGLRDYTILPDPAPRGTESRLREPLRPRHAVTALSRAEVQEVQLAEVGAALDRQEALALGGGALGGESGNVRADGFFSVQARAPSNLYARPRAMRLQLG